MYDDVIVSTLRRTSTKVVIPQPHQHLVLPLFDVVASNSTQYCHREFCCETHLSVWRSALVLVTSLHSPP